MKSNKRKGIPAAAFMAHLSTAGREPVRYDAARGCTHPNTVVERWDEARYVRYFEEITCRDCGEDLVERKGELVARKRKAA